MTTDQANIAKALESTASAHHRIDRMEILVTQMSNSFQDLNGTMIEIRSGLTSHMDVEQKLQEQQIKGSESRHGALMARFDKMEERLKPVEESHNYVKELESDIKLIKRTGIVSIVGAILTAGYYFIKAGFHMKAGGG